MSPARNSTLPSGVSQPLQPIKDDDQSGLVAILAAFSLSLVLTSVPIRTYVRGKLGRCRADDYAFFAASFFAILQGAAVFFELNRGLGKSKELLDLEDELPREKVAYAADILYIITLFLSKCSTAFFFLRLTPGRGHSIAIWSSIYLSVTWMMASGLLVAIRCHPTKPWIDISSKCTSLFIRWGFIGSLDIVTEATLFAISVFLVWGVQMSMASKAIVVGAFGFRLPVIALAALRLHYLSQSISSSNPTLTYSPAICCTQVQIGYSILSSIIPCLKNFMVAFDKPTDHPQYIYESHHKLSRLPSNSQDEMISSTGTFGKRGRGVGFAGGFTPECTSYEARIVGRVKGMDTETRLCCGDERGMRIQKGVEWSVDYGRKSRSQSSQEGNYV